MRAALLIGLFASTAFAAAQAVTQTTAPGGRIHTNIEGIEIPPIADAPFTAKVVVNWDEPLIGGGTVSRMYYTVVARDTQGRVRRETRDFVPANSTAEPPLRSFTLIDPTSGTRITCGAAAANCTTTSYQPPAALTQMAPGSSSGGAGFSRVSLGRQTMDSLPVVGTRETMTTQGYGRLVVSQRDLWYSPDLQMDLSVVRNDPQSGQVTLNVTDLVRGNPDPSLLTVPAGYQVVDARNGSAPQ